MASATEERIPKVHPQADAPPGRVPDPPEDLSCEEILRNIREAVQELEEGPVRDMLESLADYPTAAPGAKLWGASFEVLCHALCDAGLDGYRYRHARGEAYRLFRDLLITTGMSHHMHRAVKPGPGEPRREWAPNTAP
jgi:hypothetical protein